MISKRAFRVGSTQSNTMAPRFLGTRGAIATEHYLSAQAGADILKAGGNAVDAAVAAALVEGVVNPHMHTLGGECPMLISMDGHAPVAINGNTMAPAAATPEAYRARGLSEVPDEGILAAGAPAAFGAYMTALEHFGSMPFHEVVVPALDLARDGFALHRGLIAMERFGLRDLAPKFLERWPGSAALYLPAGEVPEEGWLARNVALAGVLEDLAQRDRSRGSQAAVEAFYRGFVADEIDRYSREHDGLITGADLAAFTTRIEQAPSYDFRGTTLYKCPMWSQGPVGLQTLAILDNFDLGGLGHNSVRYLHLLIEATKLAYADREQYYGDPQQVDVPGAQLLARDYGRLRAVLVGAHANAELRPGHPRAGKVLLPAEERLGGASWGAGTVHVDVADRHGNLCAFTPSGGWIRSNEVISSLGFPLTIRLMTCYLGPAHHPNVIAPGKRPRTTLSPSLALRGGTPWMAFGSMGGDQQDQWQLQMFLNCVVFGMTPQQAIEAPKFSSEHFNGFFAPHDRYTNRVRVEQAVGQDVLAGLAALGHEVDAAPDWTEGYLLAACRDPVTGMLEAAADPRGTKGDVFPACALAW